MKADKDIARMTIQELKAAMRADGEFGQGFVDNYGGGFCGPAWIHRAGRRLAFPAEDADQMRAYLQAKAVLRTLARND